MRKRVAEFLSARADSFHNPLEGEDYLYEQNRGMHFDLLDSQELKDQTNTTPNTPLIKRIGIELLSIPPSILGLILQSGMEGVNYFNVKRI